MKLQLNGHDERYVVEQSLLALFPGELPVYEPITPGDDAWAVVSLQESENACHITVEMAFHGKTAVSRETCPLSGSDFDREGQRRHAMGRCFFLATREVTSFSPPWGMLTGVRPDKPVTRALAEGKTAEQARAMLERDYFVAPERAALALETGAAALTAAKGLGPRDIAVYVGIPFCPTRCAYCSFVSQSVERSFSQVPPYVDSLIREIRSGGEMVRRQGLRVRAFYMGGGTPTTLTAEQMDRVLTAFEGAFDRSFCDEITVEAGRPDTITAEKLAVLKAHGVTRVSVNPQTMEDHVLRAIGRRHTAGDIEKAMGLVAGYGFPHVNMDLIAGLPEDSPAGFRRSLDRCLAFGTDNITIHTLALKKGSRILLEGLSVPGPEEVGEMLAYAEPLLRGGQYLPYYLYRQKYMSGSFENIGWCRNGAECWYNIYIMSELCSILSFGAGGSTKMVEMGTNHIERVFNLKYPKEYTERPEKGLANQAAFAAFYDALH
ncbi:coproporphyrinogen dehydrogenase HemZ [Oscillibacter sp.]|uniref:coproporphyrinogen dehydrogenase HemZ n=1 Tax=Oscillibacter sp. TaxID=1945593 RepID=UPI0026236A84|nr:coproporphyrinogen dehydrogenase HemZ [Oscillibacter sp.]MDD3347578.1 coproporphyrinogen dehydrogenase HemZ [Oscillibacter sp.]